MSAFNRHTDFSEFEKGDRVAVAFTRTPRRSTEDERRITGEIIALYTEDKALIDATPDDDTDSWFAVDFSKKHGNDGVRRWDDPDGIGFPVYAEHH